jgi:hypothetical protein
MPKLQIFFDKVRSMFLIGVAVGIGLKIAADALVEGVCLEEVGHHPDDGAALRVGDRVEYLVDLVRIVHGNRDRMRRFFMLAKNTSSFKSFFVFFQNHSCVLAF